MGDASSNEISISLPGGSADSSPATERKMQHPLRNRAFRLLWIGNTISWTGDQFYLLVLPWLVLSLTGSSIVLGAIEMLAAVPRAVLMLVGGAVSDRVSPRRILMLTAFARALLVGAVAALLFLRDLRLWELYFLALGFGVADAFSYPAGSAFLPSIVEPEQLPAANSVSASTRQITTLAVPGPAGLFIRAFGNAWAFLLDAISFFGIVAALVRLPDPPVSSSRAPKGMMRSIADGLRHAKADVSLRSLLLVIAVLNFALAGPVGIGLAVIAKHQFGTASAFGFLMAAFAAGSLVGMLGAGFVPQRRRGLTLLLAGGVIGFCVAPIGFLGRMTTLLPDLVLMSCAAAFINIQLISWFQQRVERDMLGRVMSVVMFASMGLLPFSLAIAGVALKASITGTFLAAGAMVLLVTMLAASHRAVRAID
jgi:Transmembrane secretion effector